jgi:hypothetical protein
MPRTLLAWAVLAALPPVSRAGAASPQDTVIRLSVQPMAAPRPALRYQLLPELAELNPGNPVPAYLKCFTEQPHFFLDKQAADDREKYGNLPLADLPAASLRSYGGAALRQADWAARLDAPDWQILLKLRVDGLGTLLPEIQQLRVLAAALKVRFRAEVAQCRFDDAVRTAKTMFAMARHLSKHPTLVGNLVGVALAHVAVGPLEEMLEQPGCPNLYWALTSLPQPLVGMRQGIQGEVVALNTEFSRMGITAAQPMSQEQLDKLVQHFGRLLSGLAGKASARDYLDARIKDEAVVRAARQRLVESGLRQELVNRFPPGQVILLDEKLTYDIRRDELLKLMALPHWEIEARAREAKSPQPRALFDDLLGAADKVARAQARLEQRIALLRHVEAFRLYAAAHDGKLPARLSDVDVPLPVDPFTGKPFAYKVEGRTALVEGAPSPFAKTRYEVTTKK